MDHGIHFISGLPRSGSTLLAALLRQNPAFHAHITSPLGSLFTGLTRQMSQENETAVFVDDHRRRAVLRGVFDNYYAAEHRQKTVFDTNRLWAAKIPALAQLFPEARIICCVRHVPWIIDSMERLAQQNPLEPSRIFAFDPAGTVYTRYEMLAGVNGLVGYAWNALRQAFYGEQRGRLMLLTYETLASDPARALAAVYKFIGAPGYTHDFANIKLDTADFDARLGAPGLHSLRPAVSFERRETILPPELFERIAKDTFWIEQAAASRGIPIIW
jgi:sulfotransferase